ncbi:MAG: glycosyltransferase family 39 protein, partial [Ardenticatenaceae bacterium]|nr:glycosyltransferase family 39 protein [Ardenticatenaceae bacterium]
MRPNPKQTQRHLLLICLLLVAGLGLVTNWANPLFEPPDEYQHYQYVQHLVTHHSLPIQEPDGAISQSHQPPLYYWTGAWLVSQIDAPELVPTRNPFWAYAEAGQVSQNNKLQFLKEPSNQFPYAGGALVVHLLRLWSLILTMLGVTAVWGIGQQLWPEQPHKTALLLALSGFNPMLLYLTGAANNDSMIFLWGSLMLWLCLLALKKSFSWPLTILIGLVGGLALLTKLTGLMLLVPWSVALLWLSWQKRSWRFFAGRAFVIGGLIAAVAGWWFVRNWQIYGDPLALEIVLQVWGERLPESRTAALLWADVRYSWTNLWGRFGYGQVPLPILIYITFGVLSLWALLGGAKKLWQTGLRPLIASGKGMKWTLLTATLAVYVAALFYYIYRNPTGANGRYIFPALGAFAALLTAGLFGLNPLAKRPSLATPITLALVGIAIYSSAIYLPWVYAAPPQLTSDQVEERIDQPANIIWDDKIQLLGTAVS